MFTTLFVQPLFNVLLAFYGLLPGHDFGVAVILVTVLVRLAIWPLVTRQLHSQKLMQSLQPEIARVRKEAGGDRQKETQMLMELYKEKGTSPFAPLLPLLIQLPIFFALYICFRDALQPDKISHLTYGFVAQIPEVARVIADPKTFDTTLFGLIDLAKPSIFLAVAAGLAQWYQAKMMQPKKHPGQKLDDAQRMAQSMIYIFPFITVFIGLTLPSALALYWTVSSLIAALQQYLVLHRDAEEMEVIAERSIPADSDGGQKAIASEAKPAGGSATKKSRKKSGGKAGAKRKKR